MCEWTLELPSCPYLTAWHIMPLPRVSPSVSELLQALPGGGEEFRELGTGKAVPPFVLLTYFSTFLAGVSWSSS